jgi:hypothetical protein
MSEHSYIWGRHHRDYLRELDHRCALSAHELAEQCGYTDVTKFQRRRQDWRQGRPSGKGLIPVAYLEAIGVDPCELLRLIQSDYAEYEVALLRLEVPKNFSVLLQPGFGYMPSLPEGLSMDEAFQHVQRFIDDRTSSTGKAILHWASLKTIFFRKGAPPSVHVWPPKFVALGDKIDFGCSPTP